MTHNVPIQSLIDHIKTAIDVDPWAKEMAEELLKEQAEIVRCKDCKYRSFYCTEATDGTTLYECHHPCANSVSRPGYWFCAEGKAKS